MSEIVPEGFYKARPVSWALTSMRDGREQMVVEFGIEEGEWAGALVQFRGGFHKRSDSGDWVESEGAIKFTLGQLRQLGWQGDDLSNVTLALDVVRIRVKHSRGTDENGEPKTYVEATVAGGVDRYALPADRAKSFASRMRGYARETAPRAEASPPRTQQAPAVRGERPQYGRPAPSNHERAKQSGYQREREPGEDDDNLPF